jgi:cell wall-associated NlpC family hydrolase
MLRRALFLGLIVAVLSSMFVHVRPAQAASGVPRAVPASSSPEVAARLRGYRIVAAARAQRGKPYRYGARGPSAFDCSGLTGYAYRVAGVRLPRTASQQYRLARPVARSAARAGDLVFWVSGGHAYHVGVYAGGGKVWHAPKAGDRVRLASIWSRSQVRFGRIGR